MSHPTSPPAGWYPAPHADGELRYWDGVQWTIPAAPPVPTPGTMPQPSVIRPLQGIGRVVRVMILVSAAVSLIAAGVEAWGVAVIGGFEAGTATLDDVSAYDGYSVWISTVWVVVALAAGICWFVWQYRAAVRVRAHAPAALRRSPVWHVVSWFIPVVAFWFPFQNMKDLVRASRAAVGAAELGWWWALWIASSVLSAIAGQLLVAAETIPEISTATAMSLLGYVVLIAAAPLAWRIVGRLTDALDPIAR